MSNQIELVPNRERLQELVNALRSGEYKQVRLKLKDGDCFCIHGVMCDLHAKETGNQWENDKYLFNPLGNPPEVEEWYGLTDEQSGKLMAMNDRERKTFEEIAQYIESEYLS